jgi:arginase
MSKIIIPVPYSLSTYGQNPADSYKQILNVKMANPIQSEVYSSNQFETHCTIEKPISFQVLPDTMPEEGMFIESAADMQKNLAQAISADFSIQNEYCIIGGDHTISVGTGLGLSQNLEMSNVGLVWVDAHGDCNTPETSESKCITGYPVAVNCGYGSKILTKPFENNCIKHVAYIGLRDIDESELKIVKQIDPAIYSVLEIEEKGLAKIVHEILEEFKNCSHIWLSIDIDSLDPMYLEPGETDVPVPGGLHPRELLYIVKKIKESGKLLVTELTQVNNIHQITPITVLSSRICELALGLGDFRYGVFK